MANWYFLASCKRCNLRSADKVFVVGSKNSYIGISNNGLEIEMYINNNGKIISAFPKE